MSIPQPDLSLPSHAPELGGWSNVPWDLASFALYSLIGITEDKLTEIATSLERGWWEMASHEGSHLVRVAPNYDFKNRSLKDVLACHASLDKLGAFYYKGGANQYEIREGDAGWYPTAFIVLTNSDWENGGLMFVYAEDDEEEGQDYSVIKFSFYAKDADTMLSSLLFMDEDMARSKALYEILEDGTTRIGNPKYEYV